MKIIYISSTPSGMRTQSIYFDLMQEFVTNGHDVYCVYAEEKRNGKETHTFKENNITYLGVKTGNLSKNSNLLSKGVATLSIDRLFKSAINKTWGSIGFDLVLYSTPPITFVKTLKYFKSKEIAVYLMLKDIFPQNAVDLEMLKKGGLIHKFFLRKEKINYELSDYIGVMSPANKSYILKKHPLLKSKVNVLPNAIKLVENSANISSREDLGLPKDDVIFLYGGNIGEPQSPKFIIECINQMEQLQGAKFILCGWGAETQTVVDHIHNKKIKNTIYIGQKDVQTFNQITRQADVGLIFLDYRFTIPNFPQRLLSYLGSELPVICATDKCCDMGIIAEQNGFGYFVPSNDSEQWIEKVKKLRDDKELRDTMGLKGKQFLKSNYDVKDVYSSIMSQLKE